ncbi:MAG: hypothetical protein QOG72_990 [Sphingomonadales bacterium]|jgi:hypothetical protein|nr:hypothetical protein [Sphingomonadales bacterium]
MADSYAFPPRLLALLQDMPLEELAFTPVPVRARHDGWTVERQKWFILRLALGGCVSVAARGVGMTRKSAYRLRERPGAKSFATAWDKAQGWGQDRTVDVGLERSLCGERVPIVRSGRVVGEVHRYDNRLSMAVLNALDRRAVARPLTPAVEEALYRLCEAAEKS